MLCVCWYFFVVVVVVSVFFLFSLSFADSVVYVGCICLRKYFNVSLLYVCVFLRNKKVLFCVIVF